MGLIGEKRRFHAAFERQNILDQTHNLGIIGQIQFPRDLIGICKKK